MMHNKITADGGAEILIAEDSPTQAEQLKHLLEKDGYTVTVTANGKLALEAAQNHSPSLIISDIVMPEMNGFELSRHIKKDENLKDIPFIILTGLSDPGDIMKGLQCGADSFITKPYDEDYLLSRVQYALLNRELHDTDRTEMGIDVFFSGEKYHITSGRLQILNLLLSTYEAAVQKNSELIDVQDELSMLNEQLEQIVEERTPALVAKIAGRKRAEEQLRMASLYTRSLIEANLDSLVTINKEGKIMDVNKAAEQVIGVSRENLVGSDFSQYFTEPDHAIKCCKQVSSEGFVKDYPLLFRHTSGHMTDVLFNATVFRNEAGEVQGVLAAARDITERKKAEEALHESEMNYHLLANNSIDCIWQANQDFEFTYVNPAVLRIFGFTQEEYIGSSLSEHCSPEAMDFMSGLKIEELQKGRESSGVFFETQLFHKNGELVPVEITARMLFDENGNPERFQGTTRDITERKKVEELRIENARLASVSKIKSEFLANMSHELRTPLNSILGFSDLLKLSYHGELNEKQGEFVGNIHTSGEFLLNLINDILDLSKVEAGKIELFIEKISLSETVNETLDLMTEKAMDHNVILKVELDHETDFIEADKIRVKQILFNLLGNAVKFSKENGGEVTVTVKKAGSMAQVSISDTGIGIKEEDMGKLFNEFLQIDSGISREYEGTGLGLVISKKLVELQGGTITAKSKYGEGSTFTFSLPIAAKNQGWNR